jgi:NAD(P)-dependent dehydrogenase (short-subunit alcohol dehydrogenase family)
MDMGLEGRACVVTGASRGIGLAVAERLCGEGARVVLVARSAEPLADAVSRAAAAGGAAEALVLDITEPDAGERMVAAASERFGGLDVLVNNAGTASRRGLLDVPDDDWDAAFQLNVMAPMRAMRAAVPAMAERGWGRVVNVCSSAAKRPSGQMPEYSVAKAAELSLSRLFADEYAKQGVLVNAICPGPVKSELWMAPGGLLDQSAELSGHDSREAALEAAGSGRPIGRLAEVAEIADAIVFLCSERASYVAGAAWSVDGGSVPVII